MGTGGKVNSTQVRDYMAPRCWDPLPLLVMICTTVRIFLEVVCIGIPRLEAKGTGFGGVLNFV